ncbi:MAG: hypothetical protein H0W62_01425 [Chitinophagales bacterium]|nr:hypothetical protein [Chitinophagales bacterium]
MKRKITSFFKAPFCTLYFCCTVLTFPAGAQRDSFPFKHIENITTENGLLSNHAYSVIQDRKEFLWFLTFNGLQRYDGYTFKSYPYQISDSNSIVSDWFNGAAILKDDIIWIPSASHGFYAFDIDIEKYTRYHHQPNNSNSLIVDQTSDLAVDRNGRVWIATSGGLNCFDPSTKKFTAYMHRDRDGQTISNNNVKSICLDDSNHLWIITASADVDLFDPITNKIIRHFNIETKAMTEDGLSIARKGRNGNVWIGTFDNGFYGYNIYTGRVLHYTHNLSDPFSLSFDRVYNVFEDHSGNLWIGSNVGNGLNYYDLVSGKFYRTNFSSKLSNSSLFVNSVSEDNSGRIWLTTGGKGIFAIDLRYKKFHLIQHDALNKNSLPSNFATALLQINDTIILLAAEQGVISFNTKTKSTVQFEVIENGMNILRVVPDIWSMYQDTRKTIWFCTNDGLISYDPKTRIHHWYKNIANDSTSLSFNSCSSIIEDDKGRYWCSTDGGGLDAFDPASGKFRAFKVHPSVNSISTNNVQQVNKGPSGALYLQSWGGGFMIFNPDSETFKIYRHNANDSTTISNDMVQGYFHTQYGYLLIPTFGGGLNAFDESTAKFRAFTVKDGLPSNVVGNLVMDDNGKVWLTSDHGISSFTLPENPFDPQCKINFRNYDASDGITSNSMILFSPFKDTQGRIYFPKTDAGFFYFDPQELKDNLHIPPVYITDFKLFNHSLTRGDNTHLLSQAIENTREINLTYKQNVIAFSFAALNYIHPEKNQYAYKLNGFDKDWIYSYASERFINYTNLDPGSYTFEVKGSNNDGVWNPTPALIQIIITPPFWKTIWFRTLMGIGGASLIYGIYRYRLQEVIRVQNIRNKIASDLHDEIGSTLNSISIYSEVVKKKTGQEIPELNLIGESARKVIDAMSDIVWTINPENDSFEKIIFRMRSLTHSLMKARRIEYTFRADENLNELKLPMITRKNFYLIFKEAINNLVKYSEASRASIILSALDHEIELLIRDNGIGFDVNNPARGNGLMNMDRRANEIKASLNVESTPTKGTTIQLLLHKKLQA